MRGKSRRNPWPVPARRCRQRLPAPQPPGGRCCRPGTSSPAPRARHAPRPRGGPQRPPAPLARPRQRRRCGQARSLKGQKSTRRGVRRRDRRTVQGAVQAHRESAQRAPRHPSPPRRRPQPARGWPQPPRQGSLRRPRAQRLAPPAPRMRWQWRPAPGHGRGRKLHALAGADLRHAKYPDPHLLLQARVRRMRPQSRQQGGNRSCRIRRSRASSGAPPCAAQRGAQRARRFRLRAGPWSERGGGDGCRVDPLRQVRCLARCRVFAQARAHQRQRSASGRHGCWGVPESGGRATNDGGMEMGTAAEWGQPQRASIFAGQRTCGTPCPRTQWPPRRQREAQEQPAGPACGRCLPAAARSMGGQMRRHQEQITQAAVRRGACKNNKAVSCHRRRRRPNARDAALRSRRR